jgi:hypothetical protein
MNMTLLQSNTRLFADCVQKPKAKTQKPKSTSKNEKQKTKTTKQKQKQNQFEPQRANQTGLQSGPSPIEHTARYTSASDTARIATTGNIQRQEHSRLQLQ